MGYETIGGVVTRGETYTKLMDHLREVQECCCVLAHLHNTETGAVDQAMAKVWLSQAEKFRLIQHAVTQLAMGIRQ